MSLVEPVAKRKRSKSPELAAETVQYVRDTDYYLEDGSCVLLVEDTLFNVCNNMSTRKRDVLMVLIGTQEHIVKRRFLVQYHV
jgi:hypothetical protein